MTELGRSVVAAGYIPLDIIRYQGRTWHAAGGTAGNVASLLGFLGWEASAISDVGDDSAGRRLCKDLKKSNVAVDQIGVIPGLRTPRIVHEISGGTHSYLFRCPECRNPLPRSRPLRADRAAALIRSCPVPGVFFFDRLNAGTILLAEHFAAEGAFIVFEPSRPVRTDLTRRALVVADVVKHAEDRVWDAKGPAGSGVKKQQIQIVTRGDRGASYRVGSGAWHDSPAFSYPVVDAGGAGDWTTAGMVHALLGAEKRSVRAVGDALRWGQALAAISCGSPGARGLTKQQKADAVLQAAQFLGSRTAGQQLDHDAPIRSDNKTPQKLCSTCLQDTVPDLMTKSVAQLPDVGSGSSLA